MPTQVKRTADSDHSEVAHKRPKFDESASQKLKDQLAMKYGAPSGEGAQGVGVNIKDLSDELNKNKIAEIKKKIMANRRTRIRVDGDDGEKGPAIFADMESDR